MQRKGAALEMLGSINSPSNRSGISEKPKKQPKVYKSQFYHVNLMIPAAQVAQRYDPHINEVRFTLQVRRAQDDLIWHAADQSTISQVDSLEQEIEA